MLGRLLAVHNSAFCLCGTMAKGARGKLGEGRISTRGEARDPSEPPRWLRFSEGIHYHFKFSACHASVMVSRWPPGGALHKKLGALHGCGACCVLAQQICWCKVCSYSSPGANCIVKTVCVCFLCVAMLAPNIKCDFAVMCVTSCTPPEPREQRTEMQIFFLFLFLYLFFLLSAALISAMI